MAKKRIRKSPQESKRIHKNPQESTRIQNRETKRQDGKKFLGELQNRKNVSEWKEKASRRIEEETCKNPFSLPPSFPSRHRAIPTYRGIPRIPTKHLECQPSKSLNNQDVSCCLSTWKKQMERIPEPDPGASQKKTCPTPLSLPLPPSV